MISRKKSPHSQVATPFTFNDNIQRVTLPSQNQDTEGGSVATVAGWGLPYVNISIFYGAFYSCQIFFYVVWRKCDAIAAGG